MPGKTEGRGVREFRWESERSSKPCGSLLAKLVATSLKGSRVKELETISSYYGNLYG